MKYRLYLSAIFLLCAHTFSFSNNPQDSLPTINPEYKGFRIAITDLVVEQIEDWVSFQFTTINTGVEDIKIGENVPIEAIVLNIEDLTSKASLKKYASAFKESFFNSDLTIKAGEIIYKREIRIQKNTEDIDLTAEIAEVKNSDLSTSSAMAKGMTGTETDNSKCSDLIIESISIVKKTNNSVTLKYKIKNQGKQPALIAGASKSQDDNLALKFHMSSSEKLTRGAIPIGETIVKTGKRTPDGKLYPGKSLTEEIKLDIRNMTRFTPVIIIEIDPYLSVQECSKTNNLNHINVQK